MMMASDLPCGVLQIVAQTLTMSGSPSSASSRFWPQVGAPIGEGREQKDAIDEEVGALPTTNFDTGLSV